MQMRSFQVISGIPVHGDYNELMTSFHREQTERNKLWMTGQCANNTHSSSIHRTIHASFHCGCAFDWQQLQRNFTLFLFFVSLLLQTNKGGPLLLKLLVTLLLATLFLNKTFCGLVLSFWGCYSHKLYDLITPTVNHNNIK